MKPSVFSSSIIDELNTTMSHVKKSISCIRASNSLGKIDRINITREKIFSRLGNLPFIVGNASDVQIEKLKKCIILSFKKATYLHFGISTKLIESYLLEWNFLIIALSGL